MHPKTFMSGVLGTLILFSCKDKEDASKENFLPVQSFIKSQVQRVDTSVYPIKKVIILDSLSDTSFVKREDFSNLAKDFLETPDLTDKKNRKYYNESNFFDQSINRVVITYTPTRDDLELRREEVHILPDQGEGDQISTIIMDKFISTKDSNVQKRLLWQMDDHFQVVTTVQKPGQPEKTTTLKVFWQKF